MAEATRTELDLTGLDDRAIQKVLRELDSKDVANALRGAPKRVLAVNTIGRTIEKLIEAGEIRRGRATPDVREATSAKESFLAKARKAKVDGLLSLEEDIDRVDDAFLREGLQLVIDGTGPALVEGLLRNRLESFEQQENMRRERELAVEIRRKKMILDGVLSVQWGDNPQMLAQRLDSHRAGS